MIFKTKIQTDVEIHDLTDLRKLGVLEKGGWMKVNKSQLARNLGCDRRTIEKYMDGFAKSDTRNKGSKLDQYYDRVAFLLADENTQVFFYKRDLWQYLVDHDKANIAQSTFRRWIQKHEEFQSYFNGNTNRTVNGEKVDCTSKHQHVLHYETEPGEEAQIDWKEQMTFLLKDGTFITINIFAYVLSCSRFKVWQLSIQKTRSILFHLLDNAFEMTGGVPKKIRCDNMATVMDEPRTDHQKGKVNKEFQQFADDYGFEVKPCRVAEPQVKAKVESPMRILDELYAYNGTLDLAELNEKLKEINNRENAKLHESTGRIPILHLKKEKDSLSPLPQEKIRNLYRIKPLNVKVNSQGNITYKKAFYSVPASYIGKQLTIQVYDEYLHVYSNTKLVTVHSIVEGQKWNYKQDHYEERVKMSITTDKEAVKKIAEENLKTIGDKFK